jgi:hypothetical protein
MKVCFFKVFASSLRSVALMQKSNQKSQEIPEAISCADRKTKAKKCPRLPLFLKSLSSFVGGNFGRALIIEIWDGGWMMENKSLKERL